MKNILGFLFFIFAANSFATTPQPKDAVEAPVQMALPDMNWKGVVLMSAEFGGDTLLDVKYTDGSSSNIQTGRGLVLSVGAIKTVYETAELNYDLQGTAGVKWTSIKESTNADANLYRWPLELLGFVRGTHFRAGVGPTYHVGNKFNGSGLLSAFSMDFKNAFGFTAEADYFPESQKFFVGARYTSIKYEPNLVGAKTNVDGSSFGAHLSFLFH